MPQYAKDMRKTYDEGKITKEELVKLVLEKANEYSDKNKGERLAERGIKALLQLTKEREATTPITLDELSKVSGIEASQTPTRGLWPWLQAGVVGFVILDNFYSAIEKAVGCDEHK